ncbi:MAG TPA: lytic transglycosylase domain-containing protein [Gammaproteobacteria bacterium]
MMPLTRVPAFHRLAAVMAAVLSTCAVSARADEIFKYVAADGTVTYSAFKPQSGSFKKLEPSCLLSYIGCEQSHADWSHVPLNHAAYRQLITDTASRHGVDPALLRALIHAESNFNHQALSRAGAQGLMQLMPQTQKQFGVKDPYNVGENVEAGTRLLKRLLVKYRNDFKMAAAAYNAGEEAVERYRGVPPYEETQNYVRRVSQLYSRYRS